MKSSHELKLVSNNVDADFLRSEDKYFIPKKFAPELELLLSEYIGSSYPSPETKFNEIESIYLDSPRLVLFQQHFANLPSRRKIRIRKYGPNGHFSSNDPSFVELKMKEDGISRKWRLALSNHDCEEFLASGSLVVTPTLLEANSAMKERRLFKLVNRINETSYNYHLMPSMLVTYTRKAFENSEIRVTLDENIRDLPLRSYNPPLIHDLRRNKTLEKNAQDMTDRFNFGEQLVLELKHHGIIPTWLTKYLADIECPKISFSKYAWSLWNNILVSEV